MDKNEFFSAMSGNVFSSFIEETFKNGELASLLPEVCKLWEMPEKLEHHPEGNSGSHTLLVLHAGDNYSPKVKFALLLHDIGKIMTSEDVLPAHIGHEKAGLPIIEEICTRLQVPNDWQQFALLSCKLHMKFKSIPSMKVGKVLDFLNEIQKNDLFDFIEVCRCDASGRQAKTAEEKTEWEECIAKFHAAEKRLIAFADCVENAHPENMPNYETAKEKNSFEDIYKQYLINVVLKGI